MSVIFNYQTYLARWTRFLGCRNNACVRLLPIRAQVNVYTVTTGADSHSASHSAPLHVYDLSCQSRRRTFNHNLWNNAFLRTYPSMGVFTASTEAGDSRW